jgi:hypothetical protein
LGIDGAVVAQPFQKMTAAAEDKHVFPRFTWKIERRLKMKKIFMLGFVGVFLFAANAWSDTLVLRDGTRIDGVLVSRTSTRVSFRNNQGVTHRYTTRQLQGLEMTSSGQHIAYKQNGLIDRSNSNNANNGGNRRQEVLPNGTEFVVRTNEEIDSKTASGNQTFAAQMDQDVLDASNNVVVPRGSDAVLVIRSVSNGGAVTGPSMTLDIQSITVAGRRYLVSTADLQKKSNTGLGANKRTAEMVGGGAALGALVGAIIGHGKGAAIGAAAGGAGGAGVEVLVKGKEVRVPAETVLKFRLDRPVTLWATN